MDPQPATSPVVIQLSSRRVERIQRMSVALDGISAINLAVEARDRLGRGGGTSVFGWVELGVAALLAVATVMLVRGRAALARWVDGLAGAVMLLDGFGRAFEPHRHIGWPLVLNGVALLGVAVAAPWIDARRSSRRTLRLDGDALAYRRFRFRRFTVPRAEISGLVFAPDQVSIHTRSGRPRRINLADLHNRDEVETALRTWASSWGVPVDEATAVAPGDGTSLA